MNKKHIRLTESDIHRIVKESVKQVLKEEVFDIQRLQAEIDNSVNGETIVKNDSTDDMVTIIAHRNIDFYKLDAFMYGLGYVIYTSSPNSYTSYTFLHKDRLNDYFDDKTANQIRKEYGIEQ